MEKQCTNVWKSLTSCRSELKKIAFSTGMTLILALFYFLLSRLMRH